MNKINKRNIQDIFALTPMQEGMLFHYLSVPGSTLYFEQLSLSLAGEIDFRVFKEAWNAVVENNEALRTVFRWEGAAAPVQIVLTHVQPRVEWVEFPKNGGDREKWLENLKAGDRKRGFDLRKAEVPFRVTLCKVEAGRYVLILSNFHILYDGWSNGIILNEFFTAYHVFSKGESYRPPVKGAFKDFIRWIRDSENQKQEVFWKGYLKGMDSRTELPVKMKGKEGPGTGRYCGRFDEKLKAALENFVKEHRLTPATFLYTAWGVLVQKYNRTDDVLFGTTVSGRSAKVEGIEHTAGLFITTIPVRVREVPGEKTINLLFRVDRELQEREAYEHTSLVDIKAYSEITESRELFDTILVVENYPLDIRSMSRESGLSFTVNSYEMVEATHYDLSVTISTVPHMEIVFSYKKGVLDSGVIAMLFRHFSRIVSGMLSEPEGEIASLEMISVEEKERILYGFNKSGGEFPADRTIPRLFEEQVERTPDCSAVTGGSVLTYRELNDRSDELALHIVAQGVGDNRLVGLVVERSIELIAGILGILKAGCGYVPLNPEAPSSRTAYMLKECGVSILLTTRDLVGELPVETINTVFIDDFKQSRPAPSSLRPVSVQSLAYVIFTSGSTGRPKGVPITHSNFSPLLHWGYRHLGISGTDRVIQNLSYYFDWAVWEIFLTLTTGASLYMVPDEILLNPGDCIDFMDGNGITVLHITPTQYRYFVDTGKKTGTLNYLFIGAERLTLDLAERSIELVNENCRIFNMYGPTEATIISAVLEIHRDTYKEFKRLTSVPIGKPAANLDLFILDQYGKVCPVNIPGELVIAGDGVARGYLNNPELTNSKFQIPNHKSSLTPYPLPLTPLYPLYRSGDRCRWLSNGTIEFLGRLDQQVKIRGFRIELGEIENQLLAHPGVKGVVVTDRDTKDGETYLCAYIVGGPPESVGSEELKQYLSQTLPVYMIPSYFVYIEKIPLNSNGKVDRRALPEPGISDRAQFIPPVDDVERALAEMWSSVLNIEKERIGIDSDFFELGGHSLKAVTLTGRIHKAFDIKVPMVQLFEAPTIRGIRAYMDRTGKRLFRAMEPVEEKEYYPLSPSQKRMYVLHQLEGKGTVYNITGGLVLEGEIEKDKFEFIFRELINRHECLRTSFLIVKGEPVQRINRHVDFEIEYFFSTPYPLPLTPHFLRSFDLARAPLLRVGLVKSGDNTHLLLFDMHHIVSDGMSVEILIKEFTARYRGEVLPPLRVRYRDYCHWHRAAIEAGNYSGQADYWREQFRDQVPVFELPVDFARPPAQSFKGSLVRFEVTTGEARRLKTLALNEGTTLYSVLLAVYNVFLSKIGNRETIIVGTPAAGRGHADLEAVFGLFINTLALKNNPGGGKTFTGFLEEVGKHTLDAFENQDYPFEELVENLDINRDPGRHPLFDTMFALQTVDISSIRIPGLKTRPYEYETGAAHFDLLLQAIESEETIRFTLEYGTDLFEGASIYRFIDFYKRVVSAVLERPTIKLMEIEIISHEEKELLLREFNDTAADYPRDKSIHRLFEEEVEKYPDHAAVVFENRVISYGELNRRAGVYAGHLQVRGVGPGKPVAIMPTVSLEMILGVLAILKAGGAYVPIEPDYPEDRIRYILDDSKAGVLLSEMSELSEFSTISTQTNQPTQPTHPTQLCYIIYTSGSTGKPKGVMVEHRNVVRLVKNTDYIEFRRGDRVLQTGALAFDASTFEIWGALLNGLTLYLAEKETILSPPGLKRLIESRGITTMWMTAPLFNRMVESDVGIFGGLGDLLVGGDVLSPVHINRVREAFPRTRIINGYGPTENTTFSTTYLIDSFFERNIPIGGPIANSTAYILNKAGGIQPIGIYGELWLGGDGIARGYLNNPELTNSKFQPPSFPLTPYPLPLTPLYRSGDLARWLPNGTIEFLGRLDQQVKIRGFRIEPGEIEGCLLRHPGVNGAVVLPKGGADKQLCAYIVSGDTIDEAGVKAFLSGTLPDYMIPAYFVFLDSIPLTANGKVDKRALPEPEADGGTQLIAPRDERETALVEIWGRVLGIESSRFGINSDFFELGGHSIKAALLVSEIFKTFDVNLSLTDIFTMPTVRELSAFIKGAANIKYTAMEPAEKREYYPLSSAQKRLYILQQVTGSSTVYNITLALELEGELDGKRLEETFTTLIRRHESFRTSFHRVHDEPVQKIHHSVEFKIDYFNKENNSSSLPLTPYPLPLNFDLSQAPLVRVGLIKRGEADFLLIVDMHHIISDGTSVEILVREFTELYGGSDIPGLPVQYKDYTMWYRGVPAVQREYWKKEFAGEIPVLDLPTHGRRPAVQVFEGRTASFSMGAEDTETLKKTGLELDATLFMVLQAVTHIFLSKISGREDIVVGTPAAGRGHPDTEGVIGMFVNMLAIRSYPTGEKTFREYLAEIKEKSLSAYENRDYPYEDLVETLGVRRDAGRNPLFDVAFALQEPGIEHMRLPGLNVTLRELETGISKFDLTVFALHTEGKLHFRWEYCTALFEETGIERFTGYFKRVVSSVVKNPVLPLGDIEIISEGEKKQVLYDFNRREARYPADKTLHGLFEEQVEKTPDTIALGIRETQEKHEKEYSLSYKNLNEKAGRLAVYLEQRGVGENSLVGLNTHRSPEMIIGILGILKAGCGYVPVNPAAPDTRTAYMMRECGASMLLTSDLIKNVEKMGTSLTVSPSRVKNSSYMAYVIFTSGSSGKPKGVPITHANISPLLHWGYGCLDVGTGDRVIQNLSYYFDWSVWEIFLTLTTGAGLHVVAEDILLNPVSCIDYMDKSGITVLHITPGQYRYLVNTGKRTGTLNYLFIGAETLSVPLTERGFDLISENCRMFNMYGPTEATIISAVLEIHRSEYRQFKRLTSVPIGKPAANPDLFILDKYSNVCPVNIPGELVISGDAVAHGYLNNPELTNSKFQISNHNAPLTSAGTPGPLTPLYRTGDRCRWLPNGTIEFLGRLDQQVKIRGYRIELGEIENRLLSHKTVTGAVVIDREGGDGEKYLCAYVVVAESGDINREALISYLSRDLPNYMIPSHIVFLEKIPLNPNGKVDRKALPAPEPKEDGTLTTPRDALEQKLADIWAEVLNVSAASMGIDSDFFELGGHSLRATVLATRVHKELNVKLPLTEVFTAPTIRGLGEYIRGTAPNTYTDIPPVEKREYYPLSSAQKRLYLLYRMDTGSTGYNMPSVLRVNGNIDKRKMEDTFRQLILRHESLRTSFHMVAGEPVQKINRHVDFKIEYSPSTPSFTRSFDLSRPPLLRAGLVEDGAQRFLVVDMHHIISDGTSVAVLINEFITLYKGETLPEHRIRYIDYARWQNSRLESDALKKQEAFWLREFEDEMPVLQLPVDFPGPLAGFRSLEGGTVHFEIGETGTRKLQKVVSEEGSTFFIVLLSLLNILLSRLCGQEDIVVGTPVAGRLSPELETIIGMFVNTLALRNYPSGDKTFRRFHREVKEKSLAAVENQGYQFEDLVETLPVNRDTGRNPLFDVALDFLNVHIPRFELPGLTLEPYPFHSGISKFDLVFHCELKEDRLLFTVEYGKKIFKKDTVLRFMDYFKRIVSRVIADGDIEIGEIDILSEEEKRGILSDLNGTPGGYSHLEARTLVRMFEHRAARDADKISLIMPGKPVGNRLACSKFSRRAVTYGELEKRAHRLAQVLRKKGVVSGNIVGILMDPSPDMIIAVLGILKAGGTYLPIDPTYPGERVRFMLEDSSAVLLLTTAGVTDHFSFTALQGLGAGETRYRRTAPRGRITDFDRLNPVDRSSVDYRKYNRYIGQAMVKDAIALQATRGCPYDCAYCHKIWSKKHVRRSAENVFYEVRRYYETGIRRFVFIDDIFNIDVPNSRTFFQLIIQNNLDVQLFFPNGLRGDLLTKEYIDLMVKAGTVNIALALETASPRLQKLIGKNLDLPKFRENLEYICTQYPHVILELFTMHGFPTETEEEAQKTLEFVKSLKWVHFPYVHILKIYPSTDMAVIASENGISERTIRQSADLAFHQLPDTLPFDKQFTLKYQADFLNRYFLLKERLLHVLPYQMSILTEDEMVQKYNSYLPVEIKTLQDLLEFAGLKEDQLERPPDSVPPVGVGSAFTSFTSETVDAVSTLSPEENPLKVLLLDLSQFFSGDKRNMLYDVVEPPLGLMYLLTALKRRFGQRVEGKIAKSRIDFDDYGQLKELLETVKPDIIGIRTLSYYKDFFHQTVSLIRGWGIDVPVIAGGPYATSDYASLLRDRHIDLVVLGEGEETLCDLVSEMLKNHVNPRKLPALLNGIAGIAYAAPDSISAREILFMDDLPTEGAIENAAPLPRVQPDHAAYIIYTSGTTGKPKGVLVEHRNIAGLMTTGESLFHYNNRDIWTLFHSYCFDFSVWEMYGALLFGGKLVLVPRMLARDPGRYRDLLERETVTILNQTPTVFYQLSAEDVRNGGGQLHLRYVIFGGEALKPGKLKPWKQKYPGTRLINMYGITETTVHVTFKEITAKEIDAGISNIGKPISSLSVYVVNKHKHLQPRNVAGELYVGGQGVARGYLNRPELTAERFPPAGGPSFNTPYPLPHTPLYRSGDLVRVTPGGEMEYLGRIDYQVKVRGNRVELGEIERRMTALKDIEEVLVTARTDEKGDNYLCAYMRTSPGKKVAVPELRESLSETLPVYMVPSYFIPLETFPVTSTGKVDRRKLPEPEGIRPELGAAYAAPDTDTARTVAAVWREILNVDKVGIHDNFFDLGGSSLHIVRLSGRLKEVLGKEVPIVLLFEHPTIHTFCRHLAQQDPGDTGASPEEEKKPDLTGKLGKGRSRMKGRRERIRRETN